MSQASPTRNEQEPQPSRSALSAPVPAWSTLGCGDNTLRFSNGAHGHRIVTMAIGRCCRGIRQAAVVVAVRAIVANGHRRRRNRRWCRRNRRSRQAATVVTVAAIVAVGVGLLQTSLGSFWDHSGIMGACFGSILESLALLGV